MWDKVFSNITSQETLKYHRNFSIQHRNPRYMVPSSVCPHDRILYMGTRSKIKMLCTRIMFKVLKEYSDSKLITFRVMEWLISRKIMSNRSRWCNFSQGICQCSRCSSSMGVCQPTRDNRECQIWDSMLCRMFNIQMFLFRITLIFKIHNLMVIFSWVDIIGRMFNIRIDSMSMELKQYP